MTNREHAEYSNWKSMRSRCSSPSFSKSRNYQSKSITVCEEWDDFKVFLSDMGPKPTSKHSIDRIDNDKGYYPGNCRWATDTTQARNVGKVKTYTYKHFTGCIPEIAEEFNVKSNTIHKGIQAGKTIEATMNTILTSNLVEYDGKSMTKPEWAKHLNVKLSTLYARFTKHGDNLEKILK